MLNEQQLGEYIDARFAKSLFRLETHDRLDVASDGDDFDRFLAGLPGPGPRPWLDVIRREVAEGKYTYRVHVVRTPLTDYLRFVCEWGYVHNEQAGERIGIIDLAEQACPAELVFQDFWLIEHEHLVLMHYSDAAGEFVGAEPVSDPGIVHQYQQCAEVAWAASAQFGTWWQRHPDEWREHRAA